MTIVCTFLAKLLQCISSVGENNILKHLFKNLNIKLKYYNLYIELETNKQKSEQWRKNFISYLNSSVNLNFRYQNWTYSIAMVRDKVFKVLTNGLIFDIFIHIFRNVIFFSGWIFCGLVLISPHNYVILKYLKRYMLNMNYEINI